MCTLQVACQFLEIAIFCEREHDNYQAAPEIHRAAKEKGKKEWISHYD